MSELLRFRKYRTN